VLILCHSPHRLEVLACNLAEKVHHLDTRCFVGHTDWPTVDMVEKMEDAAGQMLGY